METEWIPCLFKKDSAGRVIPGVYAVPEVPLLRPDFGWIFSQIPGGDPLPDVHTLTDAISAVRTCSVPVVYGRSALPMWIQGMWVGSVRPLLWQLRSEDFGHVPPRS